MPIAGQLGAGDFMGAGSNFGSAFGPLPEREPSIQPFTGFNPTGSGIRTPNIQPLSPSSTMTSISNMLNQYGDKKWGGSPSNTQGGTGPGPISTVGGDWSGVEQWNSAIANAASRTGVDANLIKAVMKLESNGDPDAAGAAGVWGPMQVNSNEWGQGPWMSDANANILKGAEILKYYLDANGGDMHEALRGYHGYGFDGYTTDAQYADDVMRNYNSVRSLGGTGMGAGLSSGSGGGGLTTSFGQYASVPDWGEFNAPSGNGLYNYGTQYGMNGLNHTGVDIPMPVGTAYRAPMSGVVTCGGTGQGAGADGGGCAAFNDQFGNGAGRVEVLLDNGAVLIFGHSSTSAFRPGQRFNAGDVLGTSGGMNSAHVHLEARVRDPSTPSGWRIVDPRTVLGGGVPGMGPISGSMGAPAAQAGSVQSMFNKFQGYGGGTASATTPQQALFQKFQRGY